MDRWILDPDRLAETALSSEHAEATCFVARKFLQVCRQHFTSALADLVAG